MEGLRRDGTDEDGLKVEIDVSTDARERRFIFALTSVGARRKNDEAYNPTIPNRGLL